MDDVLAYWFGEPPANEADTFQKIRRWFMAGPALDGEVIARFGALVEAAMRGELDDWAATARGRLALIILLDQLTRHVYRGQARMYDGDAHAQALALEAFDRGIDRELSWTERFFLSMPLLHSESPAHHERLAPIAAALHASVPPLHGKMVEGHSEQVAKYADIVRRFGRFPHRNAILGRASTPEEQAFLVEWEAKAAPQIARDDQKRQT